MRLLESYELPWTIEQDFNVDIEKNIGGFVVYDVNRNIVMNGGTYTGDGDIELNLDRQQAQDIVDIVNALFGKF